MYHRIIVPWTLLATMDCLRALCNKLLISKKKKHKEKVQESVTCHINIIRSHNKCGKIVHRPCSSCISSIQGIDKDFIYHDLAKWLSQYLFSFLFSFLFFFLLMDAQDKSDS